VKHAVSPYATPLICATVLSAQSAPDNDNLLTTFQNPVGDLISVPFQNNINFPIGQYSRIQDVLNIQPVVPIHINEDWLLITRWIVPVVYQPNLDARPRQVGRRSIARSAHATEALDARISIQQYLVLRA
jgi:hypothetical protein